MAANQIEDLNESRFLVEELNLDEQPTEEQVLERAQQLQIDDLILARESLTKQLDPQWRPYSNRHSQIYYINLLDRLAYEQHPIDMFYKKEYAKINGLPSPRFESFKLQEVANSLKLIEQQIKAFKTASHKTTLRIVYEQPSEQQAISSHPRSPSNDQYFFDLEKDDQVEQESQLTVGEIEQLYAYERELQHQYQRIYMQKKKEILGKERATRQNHDKNIQYIVNNKIEEICLSYQEDLIRKNKLDYRKQQQRIDNDLNKKRIQIIQNSHAFCQKLERLHKKQKQGGCNINEKRLATKISALEQIESEKEVLITKLIEEATHELRKQFIAKISVVNNNSPTFNNDLIKDLNQLYSQNSTLISNKTTRTRTRPRIFQNSTILQQQRDFQCLALKKQIAQLTLWETPQSPLHNKMKVVESKSSLNLRLRMRII